MIVEVFCCDRLGRMVISQNTKQLNKSPITFSYTLYDELGRIKEVGEKAENTASTAKMKWFKIILLCYGVIFAITKNAI